MKGDLGSEGGQWLPLRFHSQYLSECANKWDTIGFQASLELGFYREVHILHPSIVHTHKIMDKIKIKTHGAVSPLMLEGVLIYLILFYSTEQRWGNATGGGNREVTTWPSSVILTCKCSDLSLPHGPMLLVQTQYSI